MTRSNTGTVIYSYCCWIVFRWPPYQFQCFPFGFDRKETITITNIFTFPFHAALISSIPALHVVHFIHLTGCKGLLTCTDLLCSKVQPMRLGSLVNSRY